MSGFRELFKVRKPGHGGAFEKKVAAAGKKVINAGSLIKNNFLSKDKKSV